MLRASGPRHIGSVEARGLRYLPAASRMAGRRLRRRE